MSVIIFDDLVEELSVLGIRVLGTGVDTDTRVEVLASREDTFLEAVVVGTGLVLVHFPILLGEISTKGGLGSSWELWHSSEIFESHAWIAKGWLFISNKLS